MEVHKDEHAQDVIYYTMTGIILFLGVFVAIVLIKERKVPRTYCEDHEGTVKRHPHKLQKDDDENDTGSDIDIGIPDGCVVIKAKKKSSWETYKLIW